MKITYYKIRKNSVLLLLITSVSFLEVSCKKLIEIPPNSPNQIVTSQVFADSTDAVAAVTGLYIPMNNALNWGVPGGGITVYNSLSADELIYTRAGTSLQSECQADVIPSSDGDLLSAWNEFYGLGGQGGILQANACIEGLKATNGISPLLKNQLIGETEVFRAFYYFNMVNWFGGVPLVTTTNYHSTESLPKATINAIYSQIETDLKEAQLRLKVTYPSTGRVRPNLYTATALLAKVYLYEGKWSSAESASSSVINSGIYSLEPNLNQVFLDGSHEAIWQISAIGTPVQFQTPEAFIFVPFKATILPQYAVTSFQLSAFEQGDQRRANWLDSNQVTTNGVLTNYYYPFKYKNRFGSPTGTVEDYMIFRLAEQYLIRAESEAEGAGKGLSGAIGDLNIVRARAGLPSATVTSQSTQTQVIAAIMHERQVELFCEWGNRWFDLKRTGTVQSVLSNEKGSPWTVDNHAAIYPIPVSQIQLDHFLTQNPGY